MRKLRNYNARHDFVPRIETHPLLDKHALLVYLTYDQTRTLYSEHQTLPG